MSTPNSIFDSVDTQNFLNLTILSVIGHFARDVRVVVLIVYTVQISANRIKHPNKFVNNF